MMTSMVEIDMRLEELKRKRQQMTLAEFIEDVESRHFRTPYDTGANTNALFIWNQVRELIDLPRLDRDGLIQRYADIDGVSFEEKKAACDQYEAWKKENRR